MAKPLYRAAAWFLGTAAALFGVFAYSRLPVLSFPRPPGPFAIGTHTFYFTDPNRAEEFASTPGGRRRFVAQIWYPALPGDGPAAPYREPRAIPWRMAYLRFVKTHARLDAQPLNHPDHFPVVFFSPSCGGYRSQNTFLAEYLVSYGYIVVGFDHPDTCARVPFPDGSVAKGLPDAWLDLHSRAALERSTIRSERILRTNVQDMQFVLDQLTQPATDLRLSAIARHMDLSRTAAVGHSFGGAAAAEACRIDWRFRAGVNMDGWMFPGVTEHGIRQPFLFLIEDDPLWFTNEGPYPDNFEGMVRWGTLEYHQSIRRDVALCGGRVATLLTGTHLDFSDMPLFEPPWPWTAKRRVPLETLHAAVNKLVLAFLDETLKGRQNAAARAEADLRPYFRFGVADPKRKR